MRPNLLVTAASRRVPLVQAFQRALRELHLPGEVVVTDVNPLSPAVHVADRAYKVPLSNDPGYMDRILELCEFENVGVIVPTIDDELPIFAAAAEKLRSQGIFVAVSSVATTDLCNDKYRTCEVLRARGVPAASSWLPSNLPETPSFPLFVKPRFGRGSIGAFPAHTERELQFFMDYVEEPVVQEFLEGREYTIDVFCDMRGRPLSIVPRERVVIRAGVIDRGRTVADPSLIALGLQCCRALAFACAVNIQCRVVDGRPVVFEINPRFSGGIPLTIAAGADFPRMVLELALGRRIASSVGDFIPDLWMTNYESSLFLDRNAANVLHDELPLKKIQEVA